MALITDPDNLNQATEVVISTANKTIRLLEAGNLSTDGVTFQALYSFLKEEWKNDSLLIPYSFPLVAITPEQYEFIDEWVPFNDATRKLIRTGGWKEIDADGFINKEYTGIVTLGTFEDDVNDIAYYQQGADPTDTTATVSFTYAGPVNEAIEVLSENVSGVSIAFAASTITRASGSWITDGYRKGGRVRVSNATNVANDGTYTIGSLSALVLTLDPSPGLTVNAADTTATFARDSKTALKLFLRVRDGDTNGKSYAQSNLAAIGTTVLDNKVFRFPLSNATDLKITNTDGTITGGSPYTNITVKYFDQAFTLDVDSLVTPRNYGIAIEVGTHAGVDGATTAAGNTLTTAEGGITGANFTGGTVKILEGTNKGTYTISGTPTGTVVTITGTFPDTLSNQSFFLQRATPIVATAEQIYEKVQYLLRQASDIDTTDQTVTGKTADALLTFVGDTLKCGLSIPSNPNGGGSGVIITGFSTNDTNRLVFVDNLGTERTYPFVAAGTITFNANLVNDTGPAKYWMFYEYTERFTNTGFSIGSASGDDAVLTSTTTSLVAELLNGDYIRLDGFANETNNGIWVLTGAPAGTGPWTAAVTKVNGQTVVNEVAGPSVSLDKNPVNSADAIIVDSNSGADITGTIGGATVAFDYDYDGNVQGGRTAGTDAAVVIRAIGLSTAQFVETTATITRATGLSFSVVSALERNYSNA